MQPVLTITTNPAVDVATSVDEVVAGPKLRCKHPSWEPGGGGVNVARAITKLGGPAKALVAVGGVMGERLRSLLIVEGVDVIPVPVSAETRISFSVIDDSDGAQYRFSVPGNALSAEEGETLLQRAADHTRGHPLAVFSGSVPPGLPDDFVARLHRLLDQQGTRLVVDTSSRALALLVAQARGVHVLRLDQKEAELLAGHPLPRIEDSRAFAATLIDKGVAEIVVMGRSADGSVLVSRKEQLHAWSPKVEVRSKIGAGDTFVGAFSLSLAMGESLGTALTRGVAGAAATVSSEGTALCTKEHAASIFERCTLVSLGG